MNTCEVDHLVPPLLSPVVHAVDDLIPDARPPVRGRPVWAAHDALDQSAYCVLDDLLLVCPVRPAVSQHLAQAVGCEYAERCVHAGERRLVPLRAVLREVYVKLFDVCVLLLLRTVLVHFLIFELFPYKIAHTYL